MGYDCGHSYGFKDTLWWYEKSEIPSTIASYFLKVDNQKSPNLSVGVSVEKGYEDKELAQKMAGRERNRLNDGFFPKNGIGTGLYHH